MPWKTSGRLPAAPERWGVQNPEKFRLIFLANSKRVRHRCKGHRANIWRRPGAKHCSSLCSQSEGGEYYGGQARAENPTKSCPRALVMFATCSWPSLCEQSELQCWRRNRRLCWPVQISAARALPLTFDISILNTLPERAACPEQGFPMLGRRQFFPAQSPPT